MIVTTQEDQEWGDGQFFNIGTKLVDLPFWIVYFATNLIENKCSQSSGDQGNIVNSRSFFLPLQKGRVKNSATVGLSCWASARGELLGNSFAGFAEEYYS